MAVGSSNGCQEPELNEVGAQDSLDFEAWTTLISTVESMYHDDLDKISLVYDSFLSEFPLCYGYWKKYAEHHGRLSSVESIVQVFERAVESAPYSVGAWVDYCSFSISSFEDPSDVCRLFERGLSFVGKDYQCNLLWDKYIEFEYSQQHWDSLANIYIKTLKFPTKKLHQYYESFKKLVAIWEETGLHESSHIGLQSKCESNGETVMSDEAEISHVVNDLLDPSTRPKALQKFGFIGEFLYGKACDMEAKVVKFEQNIRRPYFHVKPLDDCQLQNWHQYLDFVEMEGDFDWAVKIYERCLVSCAHYPEFWMRYVDFVESKGGKEIATDALHRATHIFLKNSPGIHLFNAWFKEKSGDIDGAHAAFLQCDQNIGSRFIDMISRKANMEKRMGNYARASHIYIEALDLAAAKKPDTLPMLYVHYARLQCVITNSVEAATEVLLRGIEHVPHSKLILKELLCLSLMHSGAKQVHLLDSIIARALSCGSDISGALSNKDREEISTLYLEFVDSCGSIHDIRTAWNRHLKLFPHLVRVQSSLKKSAKAGAVLKMVAEGRPDFIDLHSQKTSLGDDENQLIQLPHPEENMIVVQNVGKNEQTMNGQAQFVRGDQGLNDFEMEGSEVSKSHMKDEGKARELGINMTCNADNKDPTEVVEDCHSNGIQIRQEPMAQQEKPTSQDGLSLNLQNDEYPYFRGSKASGVETLPHGSSQAGGQEIEKFPTLSSPVYPLDKDAAGTRNKSPLPSTQRHKDSSPALSPTRHSDREGSRHRFNSCSKGRSEVGSPGNSGEQSSHGNSREQLERSLSPRRRDSRGISGEQMERSLSPRRHSSHGNSGEQLERSLSPRRRSSQGNLGEQLERSLSPRRRSSHGYLDNRNYRQRSLSPRRHNSRWHSDERWQRDRRQRRPFRYQDNSRGHRDGRMQNQHIAIGNKGQPHNVQQQVVGSAPQIVHPQTQVNQYPLPSNEDVQNTQLYNQMWQYYYQQQLLLQQQPVSQQQQPQQQLQQMQSPQQLQQQVQNFVQQQHVPNPQPPQPVVFNQQQLLQLQYQQQQLYQQPQLQQQQTKEQSESHLKQQQHQQMQLPHQQSYQTLPLQQQETQQQVNVQQHQQSQLQQQQPHIQQQQPQVQQEQSQLQQQDVYLQQQQSYQYQQLHQQQYLLYLQQLHQYQQSQQKSGLVQDQNSFQKVELPEKQGQQNLTELQHKNEKLSTQKNDDQDSIKDNNKQNQGIDHNASTSRAAPQLNSQDQLPEIEGTDM